ncbi:unnamed protein product [Pedinophyceae sp. YPF-701]|nr:unnamed protein product [Pedinophyceae sp. YPF-701]
MNALQHALPALVQPQQLALVSVAGLRVLSAAAASQRAAAAAVETPVTAPDSSAKHIDAAKLTLSKRVGTSLLGPGFLRRMFLRQVNKRIISRLSRRLAIGIPVFGVYLAFKLGYKDIQRIGTENEAGKPEAARAFAACVGLDGVDAVAQTLLLFNLTNSVLLHMDSLAVPMPFIQALDKVAIACGVASCFMGLYGELVSVEGWWRKDAPATPAERGLAAMGLERGQILDVASQQQ